MNKEEVIKRARGAGIDVDTAWGVSDAAVERFASLVAAAEREECAKLCEEQPAYGSGDAVAMKTDCANAIRNRGKE